MRWLEFMGQSLPDQIEMGKSLLQSMEVLDEEMKVVDEGLGEQCELKREMVSQMEDFKKKEPRMGCVIKGLRNPGGVLHWWRDREELGTMEGPCFRR
jgi:hypothetical protein